MTNPQFPCIAITQPIGMFYLTSIPADELVDRLRISARKDSPDSDGSSNKDVQREPSKKRIEDIARYVTDPDATFPTAIIISADSRFAKVGEGFITFLQPALSTKDRGEESEEDLPTYANAEGAPNFLFGELLDGQHRIKGLRVAKSKGVDISNFDLPVVVMLDLDLAEKAYVFSIINSKQTPVPKSLIYDLFGLSTERSPYLTCHEIARAMNTDNTPGPFYKGLKMLGKRRELTEMLTQGSFVKYLLRMITTTPDADAIALKSNQVPKESDRPFNAFFRNDRDALILKTMDSYFTAIAKVFPEQWDITNYVTSTGSTNKPAPVFRRTVGYEALMRVLAIIWPEVINDGTLSEDFFLRKAFEFKANVNDRPMTSQEFGSSSADAGKLVSLLLGR